MAGPDASSGPEEEEEEQQQQQQEECEGQKRPGTPDHTGEKGALSTFGGLENDYREALQSYEENKANRSFFVELGVGWTVDPTYAVGKRMAIFCPVEGIWHHCTTRKYFEETGMHEIQFDDGNIVHLPLLGLMVRFLLSGGAYPRPPSFSRKKFVYDIIRKGIENRIYINGYLPGIRKGLAKLKEALVHDAYYITENQSTSNGDELDMACRFILGQEETVQKYNKIHPNYLALPHWLRDSTVFPGELVWIKFQKCKEWPCLVVSPDQIVENLGKCVIKQKRKLTFAYFLGSYEHLAIDSCSVVPFAEGLLKGYHRGQPKRYTKSYKQGLEECKSYAKDGLIPSQLIEILNKVNVGGQLNEIPLRECNVDDGLDRSGFSFKSNFLLSNMNLAERYVRPSSSSKGEACSSGSALNLKSLSVKGFQVLNLGEIEWKNPKYHSKEYILPAGYKMKRTIRSKYSEGQPVAHIVEIQPAIDRVSEPIFKLNVLDAVKFEAKGSSEYFISFMKSISTKSNGTWCDQAGVAFLGLNRANVFQAILQLPDASKCSNLAPKIRKKIPRRSPTTRPAKPYLSILDEMKACQLPSGIAHVPLRLGRPFECQICCDIQEDEDDTVIQCDKCKSCVHMSCYSVQEAPNGRLWLCDVCRYHPTEDERPDCVLCPVKGGIMKRTTCGKWCHPICALWLPETSILREYEYQDLRGLIDGIHLIHKSRMTSLCMFCKQKHGAVVQCCAEGADCFRAFHFLCAKGQLCTHELVIDGDPEDQKVEQIELINQQQDSMQPAKKKRKKGNQKKEKKGTVVGHCGRLKVYCPKHSFKSTSKVHTSSNIGSNSNVDIESHSFRNKNVAEWLENKENIKKIYVEAHALILGTATPITDAEQREALPSSLTYKCINDGDGICSEVSKDTTTGVTTTTVILANPEEKALISMGENYARLVDTWKKSVLPGKSAIHGWGAFTTKKLSPGDMVIEYVGELVRPSVAEMRERLLYDTLVGAGTYVFRLNANFCVDATRSGNLAHLLNHSCSPNCASRTITVTHEDGVTMDYVIIFALRDIHPGEELTYDYRFCGEEILYCSCGSADCRGMVNQDVPAWAEPCWAPASMVKPLDFDTLQ